MISNAPQHHLQYQVRPSSLRAWPCLRGGEQAADACLQVENIFRVERRGEPARLTNFNNSLPVTLRGGRSLLWHGSRLTNFVGILAQGLRIRPAGALFSGNAFGDGVYLADVSSKSARYCRVQATDDDTALLLLCEAYLGAKTVTLTNGNPLAAQVARNGGLHATTGIGQTGPSGWKDAGCIHEDLIGVSMVSRLSLPSGRSGLGTASSSLDADGRDLCSRTSLYR